jgi:DNA ligase-1
MDYLVDLLDEISKTTKRTEKEALLESLKTYNSHLLGEAKSAFVWTYSPKHDFFIKDLKGLPEGEYNENFDSSSALGHHYTELFNRLALREVTGNEAKRLVSDFLESNHPKVGELIKRVLKRDLRAGISAKTINKIFPDLIYIHPYMRCDALNEKTAKKLSYPVYSQLKLDGMYVDIIVKDGTVNYMSRKGSILPFNDNERDGELIKYANGYVIQGEALVTGDSVESILTRTSGNGYLNSDDIDVNKIHYHVWDCIPVEDFEKKKCNKPYVDRFAKVEKFTHQCGDWIRLVETRKCNNQNEVIEHFKEVRATGQEGTVVKNLGMIWKDGTSKDQLKFKVVVECDMVVTGFNPGEGKYEGMVGSLIIQSSDGLIETSVSGFTDADRKHITTFINEMIEDETIITVKYNDVLTNENSDNLALFLPRFVKIRYDKEKAENADTAEYIKENLNTFDSFL